MAELAVIGFDLEWPCYSQESGSGRLQDKVGVITVAVEDKIAIFHVGAHSGKKPEDLIAPSLRKIIESPAIAKAGINILTADFKRLQEHFGLKPQGAVELSHLHNMSKSTHLGLPPNKANSTMRLSNWSWKYLTGEQKAYAASDAYASFMLYHCLNSRRLAMEPVPPPPLWAERYEWFKRIPRRGTMLLLEMESSDEGVKAITAADFFQGRYKNVHIADLSEPPDPARSGPSTNGRRSQPVTPSRRRIRNAAASPLQQKRGGKARENTTSSRLLKKLKDSRAKIAKQRRCEPFKIAQDAVLEAIVREKPRTNTDFSKIKGIGKKRLDSLGTAWLNIVILHEDQEASIGRVRSPPAEGEETIAEMHDALTEGSDNSGPDETAGPVTPSMRVPQLHTGLTSVVRRIDIMSKGTQSEPIELDDSGEDGSGHQGSPLAGKSRSAVDGTPTRARPRPAPLHGIMRYFPPQRSG
ncbi:Werner syndrome ATP-dependent helicase [Cytospora mali]|uniref:Werner syndrome ATP-dependent helicase n=1 Tax=Cytospora mali TaxID=578113 RepID=A0A194URT0_CYTMA|nr:Werner syndrome ATP-dependent helicase [Valsa mali var. pyri (nom. inval.)]